MTLLCTVVTCSRKTWHYCSSLVLSVDREILYERESGPRVIFLCPSKADRKVGGLDGSGRDRLRLAGSFPLSFLRKGSGVARSKVCRTFRVPVTLSNRRRFVLKDKDSFPSFFYQLSQKPVTFKVQRHLRLLSLCTPYLKRPSFFSTTLKENDLVFYPFPIDAPSTQSPTFLSSVHLYPTFSPRVVTVPSCSDGTSVQDFDE